MVFSSFFSFDEVQFLLPYVNILGLVGLRPITIDSSDLVACLGHIQTIIIVVVLTTGYFIQYFSYFRYGNLFEFFFKELFIN